MVESMMAEPIYGFRFRQELGINGTIVEDLANPNKNKQKAEIFFSFVFLK